MGNTASTVAPALSTSTVASHLTLNSTITLHNGITMPRLGFGVWQIAPQVCTSVVETALDAGYRHIDSAQAYRNEAEAGAALRTTDVPREDIFFTTKIPRDLGSVDANYESLLESVAKINGGDTSEDAYVDLFLIHTPRMGAEGIKNVWQALEKLLDEGKTRSIGVSNFQAADIEGMKEYATVWPPHVNQIKVCLCIHSRLPPICFFFLSSSFLANFDTICAQLNPWVQEQDVVKYCDDKDVVLQAYSPLENGKRLNDATVGQLAKKYEKSPAQVLIRYSLQKGWVPLPKSVHADRIVENTQIYDFELSKKDMSILDGLQEDAEVEL